MGPVSDVKTLGWHHRHENGSILRRRAGGVLDPPTRGGTVVVVRSFFIAALLPVFACGPKEESPIDIREPCADRNELRNLYYGDLHVHTSLSFDAWIYDVRLGPTDAYRFAQGEEVSLPPLDASGSGTVPVQLDRPLDFTAVTDHSEYLAEVSACYHTR